MESIRREICDYIDDNEFLTDQKVAIQADISKQQFSKYRKTGNGFSFRKYLRIAYILFRDEADRRISRWCLLFDSSENIRQSFEYAYSTRNINLLTDLLEKHKKEQGVVGECVKVYTVILKYMNDELHGRELTAHIENLKINDKSLLLLTDIIKLYTYYHLGRYQLLLEAAEDLEEKILSLSDKREMFTKECYILRICEVLTPAYFHSNNLKLARKYADILINSKICAKTISDGYYYLGMTYLIDDKVKCLENLELSYGILSDQPKALKEQALFNLNFVLAYQGKKLIEEGTCASSLKALQQARIGNTEKSLEYVNESLGKEGDSCFKKFYKALALKSKDLLCESSAEFFRNSNIFFARMVAHELKELGEKTTFIDSLINFSFGKGDRNYEKDYFSCFNDISDCRIVS